MSRYFDRKGEPIDCDAWVKLFNANRTVASNTVEDVSISTVWLGLDHRFDDKGPPLIFETMVFGGALDGDCVRYSTEEAALAGHAMMLARVRIIAAAQSITDEESNKKTD